METRFFIIGKKIKEMVWDGAGTETFLLEGEASKELEIIENEQYCLNPSLGLSTKTSAIPILNKSLTPSGTI